MQVTGKNLDVLLIALELAEEQIHNEIVTCPEPEEYKEKLAELEAFRDATRACLDGYSFEQIEKHACKILKSGI